MKYYEENIQTHTERIQKITKKNKMEKLQRINENTENKKLTIFMRKYHLKQKPIDFS